MTLGAKLGFGIGHVVGGAFLCTTRDPFVFVGGALLVAFGFAWLWLAWVEP